MKLKVKIPLLFSSFIVSIVAVLSILVYYFASRNAFDDFYKRLEIRAIIAAKAAFEKDHTDIRTFEEIRQKHLQQLPEEKEYFLKLDPITRIPESYEKLDLPTTFYSEAIQNGFANDSKGYTFYTGILYASDDGEYIVVVSADNAYSRAYLKSLFRILIIAFISALAGSIMIGLIFSRQIRNPLRNITERVRHIGSSNLHLRLEETKNKDEMGELVATFNTMLDRLETSFESQKNFVSNASHELSTPLTAIIGEAELSLRKPRESKVYAESMKVVLDEAVRLKKITHSLLDLARIGFDGKKIDWEKLRIDELIFSVMDTVHNIYPENIILLDESMFPEDEALLLVEGNIQLLHQALTNIVMNGCKYSDGKPVSISLGSAENYIIIGVKDDGIGIPENEIKYIYDPFFRASNTGSYRGYGIGLPLARNILRLHQGELIVQSAQDAGTTVLIKLPLLRRSKR